VVGRQGDNIDVAQCCAAATVVLLLLLLLLVQDGVMFCVVHRSKAILRILTDLRRCSYQKRTNVFEG
jgi:hypothetical protein